MRPWSQRPRKSKRFVGRQRSGRIHSHIYNSVISRLCDGLRSSNSPTTRCPDRLRLLQRRILFHRGG